LPPDKDGMIAVPGAGTRPVRVHFTPSDLG
jgi:hypothetical protein